MDSKALARLRTLGGRRVKDSEARELRKSIPNVTKELLAFMKAYPVVGATLRLSKKKDLSRMGVLMKWLSPTEMVEEALDFYPGIVALPAGYIPVGECVTGSGDPYFYNTADGSIVRILHQPGADEDRLSNKQVEVVAKTMTLFVEKACGS